MLPSQTGYIKQAMMSGNEEQVYPGLWVLISDDQQIITMVHLHKEQQLHTMSSTTRQKHQWIEAHIKGWVGQPIFSWISDGFCKHI